MKKIRQRISRVLGGGGGVVAEQQRNLTTTLSETAIGINNFSLEANIRPNRDIDSNKIKSK